MGQMSGISVSERPQKFILKGARGSVIQILEITDIFA